MAPVSGRIAQAMSQLRSNMLVPHDSADNGLRKNMAKSKLIVRRSKKATILVSKRTVEDALRRANNLASNWMGQNDNDPRFNELQNITDHLSSILKKTPQEMRAEGAMSIEDYFDDAKMLIRRRH